MSDFMGQEDQMAADWYIAQHPELELEREAHSEPQRSLFSELWAWLRRAANSPVELREGMVTVYDSDGEYAGCMGVETWQGLLDSEAAVSHPGSDA